MRKPIIAGNWKMNKTLPEAIQLAEELQSKVGHISTVDVVLCPSFTNLQGVSHIIQKGAIKLGAQNMSSEKSGAFTGEVSADMLKSVGCQYVIIGHSERREYFCETNAMINKKVKFALDNGLNPILCCGETLAQREEGITFDVIASQLKEGLDGLSHELITDQKELVIAYEPVWAIGTGRVATKEQAQEVHAFIRQQLATIFNSQFAQKMRIQYGGSANADNIVDLINQPDIDGALVGGASLKSDSFARMIELAQQ